MFLKKLLTCFLLLQVFLTLIEALPFEGNDALDDLPKEAPVSVFVKQFEGRSIQGGEDPRRRSFLENANEAAVFSDESVNQHPTHLEQREIPLEELEQVQRENSFGNSFQDGGQGLQRSHFNPINRNRESFEFKVNQDTTLPTTHFQRLNEVNPTNIPLPGYDQSLKEFQLFDLENSLPQFEFNNDQIPATSFNQGNSQFPPPTAFHIQNQNTFSNSNQNEISLKQNEFTTPTQNEIGALLQKEFSTPAFTESSSVRQNEPTKPQPNELNPAYQNVNLVSNQNAHQPQFIKQESRVVPGRLEAKVVPGVLMKQVYKVPTSANDPILNVNYSPNNFFNQQQPTQKQLIIPAVDLRAVPVFPINQGQTSNDLNANNFVRDVDNRVQRTASFNDYRQGSTNNNVHITGGFSPSYFGRALSFPEQPTKSPIQGRSLNDNAYAASSSGQFVPGTLEGGFVPSGFLALTNLF